MNIVLLLSIAAGGAAFVGLSSGSLPGLVASHFGFGGTADGFMDKVHYVRFMAAMAAGVPLVVGASMNLVRWMPVSMINLPNRDYWLAPERAEATRAALGRQGTVFSACMTAFMCWAHWLVVLANRSTPPRLSNGPFVAGLLLFVLGTVGWSASFFYRFSRRAS